MRARVCLFADLPILCCPLRLDSCCSFCCKPGCFAVFFAHVYTEAVSQPSELLAWVFGHRKNIILFGTANNVPMMPKMLFSGKMSRVLILYFNVIFKSILYQKNLKLYLF